MPIPNRDGVTGVDIDVGIRVGWQNRKEKALALSVRAIFGPGVGAPGGIRTHNPWVRSLILLVWLYSTRYVFRTSRPAHPVAFAHEVLSGITPC